MLSATSNREFAGSRFASTIFLERKLRAHVVRRDRLVYDSRYAPPGKKANAVAHLYIQLHGTFAPNGGAGVTGRQAWVLAESEFDRVQPGSRTFRSFGEQALVVEMRVPVADLHRAVGIDHGQVQFPDAVWEAYDAIEQAPTEQALFTLIQRLSEAGILSKDLASSIVPTEPERFARLWTVMKPLYEELSTSASLKQIATIARLSLRQLGRDLGDLSRTFGLFGGGFRDASRVIRLRAATLFLSAPNATPSEVARTVGYGSLDAMGRAFRDANLPSPSVVQDAVKYRGIETT
jgi:AraC-like DNA-binding protein